MTEDKAFISQYSDKVIDHFLNPRHAGVIENADGIGEIGDPECGDFMRVYLKIEKHIVTDVKYQIRGCPASIACASAMTELAIGKDLDDVMMITDDDIVEALDGLPEVKIHCSALGAGGLQKAIMDYYEKHVAGSGSPESHYTG
ncbi:MAG: iron-sulfur cluster assembly scaffold protein [Deltaproteobacteria bacterium]|nr:iron-sulfur cluster assembly scaffold protein [Deltaproteobacteria bacterium]